MPHPQIRTLLGQLAFARAGRPLEGTTIAPAEAEFALATIDGGQTRYLAWLVQTLQLACTGTVDGQRKALIHAVREGTVIATTIEREAVSVEAPTQRPPALGPDEDLVVEDAYLAIALFDSAARPMGGVDVEIDVPGEGKPRKGKLTPDGTLSLRALRHGTCRVRFPNLATRAAAPLDDEAASPIDVPGATALVRPNGPRSHGCPTTSTASAATSFQLRRAVAEVLELEHFNPQSAVFMPGAPPFEESESVLGVDALRSCIEHLRDTPLDRARIVGHAAGNDDPALSKKRAACIGALLTGDRDGFASIANATHGLRDVEDFLSWVAATYAWPCAPSSSRAASVQRFQRKFKAQTWGHEIRDDGVVDESTWGAFVVCMMRVVQREPMDAQETTGGATAEGRPIGPAYIKVQSTDSFAPITLAKEAKGSENFYPELNPQNPHLCPDGTHWNNFGTNAEVNLPKDWVGPLKALHKYMIIDGEEPPTPGPRVEVLKAAPKLAACGAHHVQHPSAKARHRRAFHRRVEVIVFGNGESTEAICTHDGACDQSTCSLYDPTEYTLVYRPLASNAPTPSVLPWSAQWEKPTTSRGKTIAMQLLAPDLSDGEEVEFEVFQDGVGSIGKEMAVARGGKASAPWSDWFHPSRVGAQVVLKEGEEFAACNFHFVAKAMGREEKTKVPSVYGDRIEGRVRYQVEGFDAYAAAKRHYVLLSPWGSRRGGTRTVEGEDGRIVEPALPPGGASIVIGKRSLLAQSGDVTSSVRDRRGEVDGAAFDRFCDFYPTPPRMTMNYRILTPYRLLRGTSHVPADAPPVSFRVRRLLAADAPTAKDVVVTLEGNGYVVVDDREIPAEVMYENPWAWSCTCEVIGGDGILEVTTLLGGVAKLVERLHVFFPVNDEGF